jgi:CrcB protein
MHYLLVFIGGGLGALCRFGISSIITPSDKGFPYQTIMANIISSLILGFLLSYFFVKGENVNARLLGVVGFCGGFSTFSSFSAETFLLMQAGQYGLSILNILVSVVTCILGISAGLYLGTQTFE